MRPLAGLLAVFFAAAVGITCSDHPSGPSTGLRGVLGLAPVFSKSAEDVYRNLVSFQMQVNNVRVRLLRTDGGVALDTVVTVPAGATEVTLELTVQLEQTQETFNAAIEMRDGETVLFSGTQTVTARAGAGSSSNGATVQLEYTGPGATATTLDIAPDTTIVTPDSLVMRAAAFDRNNQPVTSLNLRWSVDDATRATISEAGVLKPVGPRGSVVVTAALPTQVTATAAVTIQSRPTTVVLVGGANQTATVATNLPNAIEVEVRAADNLPVSGHPVAFSYSGTNGTVLQSGAVTNAGGRVNASINVGTLAGTHAVTINAAGIAPITTTVTATPGAPAAIVTSAGATLTDSAGANVATAQLPGVTVRDAFGNGIANAQVKFRRHGGTGATINAQPDTMVLVNTDASGVAALTSRRLQTTASPPQDTVLATVAGVSDTVRFAATVTHASPKELVFTQQPTNATSGTILAPAVTVRVRDQFGNPVTTGAGATSSVTLTLSGGTTGATLGPSAAALTQSAVNGIATFTVSVDRSGTGYQLAAAASGLTAATSSTFDIAAGVATAVVAQANLTVTDSAGASLGTTNVPSVLVRDANANGVPNVQVKFRRHSLAGGTINAQPDTLVLVSTNASGIASLTGRRLQTVAGFDTVLVTATGLNDTLRFAATVTHATASQLAFGTQPVDGTAGSAMPPFTVEVRDQFGNRVTTGANATKSIAVSMTGATLSGTTTVSAVAGVATFTGLSVSPAGSPYQIMAAASPLAAATSASFAMTTATPMTRTWAAAVTGNWETASNWSGGVVPGPQDTVVINISGEFSVAINSAVSIAKLVIGGGTGMNGLSVLGSGASLSVSDSIRVASSGLLILGTTGSAQITSGPIVIDGSVQWVQGTMAGSGGIRINAAGTMVIGSSGPTTLNGRTIDNLGTLMTTGADPNGLALANGATIENTGQFFVQGSADIGQGTGAPGSILNMGTLRKLTEAGTTAIGVAFTNSGTATLEIQTGTLAFTGPSLTNTANATIRGAGTLDVSAVATFTNAGTVSPGFSPGILGVTGNLPMQGTSKLVIDIGGTGPGESDVLNVSGTASLSGTLEVMLQSFTPTLGQSFTIMTFGSRSGTFATFTGMEIGGGLRFEPQFTSTQLNLVVVNDAPVATISWVNTAGGNWSTASNWNLNRLPTSSDVVGITAAGASFYTVTLDVDVTIAGLILGGPSGTQGLSATGRSLTINGNSIVDASGLLDLINSSVTGTGTFRNNGETTLRNTTVGSSVTIDNEFLLVLQGTSVINGQINTIGTLSWIKVEGNTAGGPANVDFALGFTNNGTLDLTNTSTGGLGATLNVLSGSVINSSTGDIRSQTGTSGGSRVLNAMVINNGTLVVRQALTINAASADHVNNGTIDLTLADLTITQSGSTPSFANAGAITFGSFRTLTVTGGAIDLTGGALTGPANSCLLISGSSVALSPDVLGVPVTFTGSTVNGGSLALASGQSLTLRNGALSDAVTIGSGGVLRSWGTVALNGAVAIASGGALKAEGNSSAGSSVVTVLNGFTNNGTVELTNTASGWSATFNVTSGTLTNASGAFISATGSGGSRTLGAQILNQLGGTMSVGTALTIDKDATTQINSGTINVTGGNLTISLGGASPRFENDGAISLGTNRDLIVTAEDGATNAVLMTAGGSVTGDASTRLLTTGPGTLTYPVNVAFVSVPLQLAATTTYNGTIMVSAQDTLTLVGRGGTGTLNSDLLIDAGGLVQLRGSTQLNGALTVSTNGTLRVQGEAVSGSATATVDSGFTNSGTIELTTNDTGNSVTLAVTNGTLSNNFGATIRSAGQGGLKTLAAQLSNTGTLDVDQPLTLNKPGATHYNANFIDLTNANLTVTQTGAGASFGNGITGQITLGATRGLTFTGGAVTLDGSSTINGPASALVTFSGVLLDMQLISSSARITGGVPVWMTGATAIVGGTLNITNAQPLTLINSTITDAVTVQSSATLTTLGSTALGGTTVQTGGTMIVRGQNNGGVATTTATSLTNNGTIELTSADVPYNVALNVSGTLTNGSSGTIQSPTGAGGTRTIGANVSNSGAIRPGGTGGPVATLAITGTFTQTSTGTLYIDMANDTSNDVVTVSGTATLAGFVNIAPISPYTLQSVSWTVMTYPSGSGSISITGAPCAAFGTVNSTNLVATMSC